MNILTSLSIRNLRLNNKRTIITIIGIILSLALICAVASMGMSFQATLVENAQNQSGYSQHLSPISPLLPPAKAGKEHSSTPCS